MKYTLGSSAPSYIFHNQRNLYVDDLASSGVRTVTEFNLSQTSIRRCHGSWQNSPHKDDFAFISITNIIPPFANFSMEYHLMYKVYTDVGGIK